MPSHIHSEKCQCSLGSSLIVGILASFRTGFLHLGRVTYMNLQPYIFAKIAIKHRNVFLELAINDKFLIIYTIERSFLERYPRTTTLRK